MQGFGFILEGIELVMAPRPTSQQPTATVHGPPLLPSPPPFLYEYGSMLRIPVVLAV